jgi:1,4-alpha-glucan branching enzyme
LAVRAYLPDTQQAWVLDPAHAESRPMRRIHPAGLFEAICPVPEQPNQRYQFRVAGNDGEVTTMHDPYSFSSLLTDFDFYCSAKDGTSASTQLQVRTWTA